MNRASRIAGYQAKTEETPALWFFAGGTPTPQGSKAVMPCGGAVGGRPVLVENSNLATKTKPGNRLADWRALVGFAGARAVAKSRLELLDEPLVLGLLFVMPRPPSHITKATRGLHRDEQVLTKSAPNMPSVKPDLSKLTRGVEDALEGIVYVNDSRIVGYRDLWMVYDDDMPMGVSVEIWRLEGSR